MAAPRDFTQPQDNQPVLKEGQVVTRATGFEAMGKALGVGADLLFKQAESQATEESNTHFLAAQSNIADAHAKAKLAILQNPDQGKVIADQLKLTTDAIKQSAIVNRKDRNSLTKYGDDAIRDSTFEAEKAKLQVTKSQIAFTTMSAWQDNVDIYNRLLYSKDPQDAIDQQEKMVSSVTMQVKQGIITPTQGTAMLDKMHEAHTRHEILMAGYESGEMTPVHYHAVIAGTPESTINNADLPTNKHTQDATSHINEYGSIASSKSARAQGVPYNPLQLSHVTNNNALAEMKWYGNGCDLADGLFNSGQSYPLIQHRINELTHTKERSQAQQGELDRLINRMNDIKDKGQVMDWVTSVKSGAIASKKLSTEIAAIDASTDDEGTKAARRDAAHNTYMTEINATMEALKIPQQLRNMFPKGQVNTIRDNLFHGGNPAIAVQAIQGLGKDAIPYMANAMDTPHQSMAVMTLSNLKGLVTDKFISDLAATQQERQLDEKGEERKAKLLQSKESGVSNPISDERIRFDIYKDSRMSDVNDALAHLPPVGNVSATEAQLDMGLRYVKGRAIQNGDLTLSNYQKYLNEYLTNIPKGYDHISTDKIAIDTKVIPLHRDEMIMVGDYILDGYYADKKKEGHTYAEIENMRINEPVKVLSFPTHHLVIVDSNYHKVMKSNGEPYYDHLYLPTVLQAAKHTARIKAKNTGEFSLKETLE